ncbi:4214_t:CDS:2 [Ambispora gerdemannii]|uniref:Eukaryotic translation initiation factor 3 30 kDa subunit n=1 Tax=Ambispora gerdemannii TaxID=144530 RepID=A0A9N9B7S9_9GLOM|nr:4214_t:CDS:2 [Ambispora gerdemannii]
MADWEEQSSDELTTPIALPTTKKWDDEDKDDKNIKKKQQQYEEEEDPVEKKNRLRKLQVEADLENAANTFGVDLEELRAGQVTLDTIDPKSREEFEEFAQLLIARIKKHEKEGYYPTFLNNFFRELCIPLKDIDIRKKPFLAAEKGASIDTTDYGNLDDDFDDFISDRVDYAIKKIIKDVLEEIISITEAYQELVSKSNAMHIF